MTSAEDAIEKAAFDLLSAVTGLGAPVYQHVPENTPPPVVIIGDIETVPLGGKDDPDRRATLSVMTVTEAEERKSLLQIKGKAEAALDGVQAEHDGWQLSFSLLGATAVLTAEGDGYVGESRFQILALRA
ncbi:DUF3168 domain-containing protein [Sphingobium bisphenolivorans]|uniref:DUF3168 domain-containing protein n=1 Tax=Sphingobium bisphenolivorans TaxID=1335760 RepID=UPI0003A31344|nr:DUF3168 domain-containing protein [Sphingobium bisphenolivorans]